MAVTTRRLAAGGLHMLKSTLMSMPACLLACDSSSACGMFLCGSKRRLWRTSSRRDFSSRACGCSAHLSTDFDTFCCQLLDVGENGSIRLSRTSSRKCVGKVRCVDVALKGKRINYAASNFFPESDRKCVGMSSPSLVQNRATYAIVNFLPEM